MLFFKRKYNSTKCLRSTVSILVAIILTLSAFSGITIFNASAEGIWDGTLAASYAGGTGTYDDPFKIETGEQLYKLINDTETDGKYYELVNDIYLNDVSKEDWYNNSGNKQWSTATWRYNPNDVSGVKFNGTLNGNGHRVFGLYVNRTDAVGNRNTGTSGSVTVTGLFPLIGNNAKITGIGIENSYITLKDSNGNNAGFSGALIGCMATVWANPQNDTAEISLCYANESVMLGGGRIGLIGSASNDAAGAKVENCYITATPANGSVDLAIIAIYDGNVTYNTCYSVGNITNAGNRKVNNCYCTGWIPAVRGTITAVNVASIKGASASDAMTNLDWNRTYAVTSSFPTLQLFLKNDSSDAEIWDGVTLTEPTVGNGSKSTPYEISTGEELAYVIKNGGGNDIYYKLTDDIYLNDVDKINWETGMVDSGYTVRNWFDGATRFAGNIDGNGFVIYGLYSSHTGNHGWRTGNGLIPTVDAGGKVVITNLGIENAYVKNTDSAVALFVGFAGQGSDRATVIIDQCYAGKNVILKGLAQQTAIFRGNTHYADTTVTNSYSLSEGNALVGTFNDNADRCVYISNSYNAGGKVCSIYWSRYYIIENTYVTDKTNFPDDVKLRTADNMRGTDVLTNESKMSGLDNGIFVATDSYPILSVFDKTPSDSIYWHGGILKPTVGEGTAESPFVINTAEEFAYVVKTGGDGKYYKLNNDIYLNEISKIDWKTGTPAAGYTPKNWYIAEDVTAFSGTIDGDNHIIYGLYRNDAAESAVAIVPEISDATVIKNLGVENAYINTNATAAAFIANIAYANATVNNCYVGDSVKIIAKNAGGIIGKSSKTFTVEDCYSLAELSEKSGSVAGICASASDTNSKINRCYTNSYLYNGSRVNAENCYAQKGNNGNGVKILSASDMKGLTVLDKDGKMSGLGNAYQAVNGSYPILTSFGDGTVDRYNVWDGTKTAPTVGDGSKDTPYEISTGEELAYAITSGGNGKYYKLDNDIYLNDIDKVNWETGEVEEGYTVRKWYEGTSFSFDGSIDGNGHVIYGLYFNDGTKIENTTWYTWGTGLIPYIKKGDSAVITNLGIDNTFMWQKNGASAFVGCIQDDDFSYSATLEISKCYVGENVTITGFDAGAFAAVIKGGLVNITNCYSLATLNCKLTNKGRYGLYADPWGANVAVYNSYNANGPISSGLEGNISKSYETVSGKSGAVKITADNMQGTDVFSSDLKMPELNSEDAYVAGEGYPVLAVFSGGSGTVIPDEDVPGGIWSGKVANTFSAGKGTEDNPYIIQTGAELAYAVRGNGLGGKYFKLACDIYLNDVTNKRWYTSANNKKWVSASNFSGHIDGDGYIVYGIWCDENDPENAAGLISVFNSGSIKNLGVRYAYICADTSAGGIVGTTKPGKKVIDTCFVDETVNIETFKVNAGAGGIVGDAFDNDNSSTVNLAISNCYSKANLFSLLESRRNGIIGTSWRTAFSVKNCYSIGYPVYFADSGALTTSAYWNYTALVISEAREGRSLSDYIDNNYSDKDSLNDWTLYNVVNDSDSLRGESAKNTMSGLDYKKTYETVEEGTPKLKIFTSISGKDIVSSKDADFFGEGSGTQKDPFIIKTVEHLRYLVESSSTAGKYYKLANDIFINDTTKSNWTLDNPVSWYATNDKTISFQGTLDGDGHSIYGLYVNDSPEPTASHIKANYVPHGTGLFPYVSGNATVRNLHIRNSYISGKGCVGAIAGCVFGTKDERIQIIGCSVDESVVLKGFTVGGLVGAGDVRVDMLYCYSAAKMSGFNDKNYVCGLIGDIWAAKVNFWECYSVGYIVCHAEIAVNHALYATVSQNKVSTVTEGQLKGDIAKIHLKDFNWDSVWYTVDGKTPQLKVIPYGKEEQINDEGIVGRVWTGKLSSGYASGQGSESDPYIIETPEQLAYLMNNLSAKFAYYKLNADIKLNDTTSSDWQNNANTWYSGTAAFRGVFDGNGHIVSGLYINTTDGPYSGLFPRVDAGSVIKRLGITKSTIIDNASASGRETYAGAIAGYIVNWEPWKNPDKEAPVISECFADESVYIEAISAGGLVGGTPSPVYIKNCFFTGEVAGEKFSGGFIGNSWVEKYISQISNSYCVTVDRDQIGGGHSFEAAVVSGREDIFQNVFIDGVANGEGISSLSVLYMRGENAKTYMSDFDWKNIWSTCEGGTPVLKCFANAKNYSCKREPKKVEISFVTQGETKCESIYGYPGYTEITDSMLPTPERYGYRFNGWYYFDECDLPFDLKYFPNYDIALFAGYDNIGFTVTFEKQVNNQYDINSGTRHFKPGVDGYNSKYFHGGLKSMHAMGDSEVAPTFLLSYENTLEVGKKYEITFWMNTDTDGADGNVELVHAKYGDVNDETVGYEEILEFSDLKADNWQQYKAVFTANSPYVLFRTSVGTSLYFDDIQVVETGENGELGMIKTDTEIIEKESSGSKLTVIIIIGAVCGVTLLAAVTTIIIIKKKKIGKIR